MKTVSNTSFVNLGLPMISGRRKESSVVLLILIWPLVYWIYIFAVRINRQEVQLEARINSEVVYVLIN